MVSTAVRETTTANKIEVIAQLMVAAARIAKTHNIAPLGSEDELCGREEIYRQFFAVTLPSLPSDFVEAHVLEMEAAASEADASIRYDPVFNTPLKKLSRAVRENISADTLDAVTEEALTAAASFLTEIPDSDA